MEKAKAKSGAGEHYVMTVPVGSDHLHCYLMTTRKAHVMAAGNELLEMAEQIGRDNGVRVLPVLLITGPLDAEATQQVRDALCEADATIAELMRTATSIHRSICLIQRGQPIDKLIMDLH